MTGAVRCDAAGDHQFIVLKWLQALPVVSCCIDLSKFYPVQCAPVAGEGPVQLDSTAGSDVGGALGEHVGCAGAVHRLQADRTRTDKPPPARHRDRRGDGVQCVGGQR